MSTARDNVRRLPTTETPRPERQTKLAAAVRDIAADAHTAPAAYLRETRVPGGGE